MAVQMCNPCIKWEGLSTDVKPIVVGSTLPIPAGWMFYETDTHYYYMWNGATWVGPIYWLEYMYPWDEYAYGY